jgi:hypothetical protein
MVVMVVADFLIFKGGESVFLNVKKCMVVMVAMVVEIFKMV